MKSKSVVMVAGEASGDLHGSHLIRALRGTNTPLNICGMGGKAMKGAGVSILIDADKLAVVGITEVIPKLAEVVKAMSRLKRVLADLRPDLLILIDYPEFNLHLAATAKKLGIPVLYYISPQLWAWRSGRVKKIKKRVDHMAVILPFEEPFYRQHDVPVSFVGHPLMDSATAMLPYHRPAVSATEEMVIGLLPGSRSTEVAGLLPRMLEAGRLLQDKMGGRVRFLISCAPSIKEKLILGLLDGHGLRQLDVAFEPVCRLLPKCHLAIVASGTVTLEAAICTTPAVITYTVSPMSYWLGKVLIKVEHIGLVNLIAKKRIVPELIQHEVTPEAICAAASAVLSNPDAYKEMCRELTVVREKLGGPGASRNVAKIAFALMNNNLVTRN